MNSWSMLPSCSTHQLLRHLFFFSKIFKVEKNFQLVGCSHLNFFLKDEARRMTSSAVRAVILYQPTKEYYLAHAHLKISTAVTNARAISGLRFDLMSPLECWTYGDTVAGACAFNWVRLFVHWLVRY